MRYLLSMDERSYVLLAGVLRSALDEADRDGRTGVWVDDLRQLALNLATQAVTGGEDAALSKINPVGNEPFGTKVTFWSPTWGATHALIVSSPRPLNERTDWLEPVQWGIVKRSGGMTFVDADQLTLGWHPDATD